MISNSIKLDSPHKLSDCVNNTMNLGLRSDTSVLRRLITMSVECLDQSVADNSASRCWYWKVI